MLINSDFTVTRVVSANRIRNAASDTAVQNHGRKRWAVVLKHEGRTYYTCGGKQTLSDAQHPVILPKGSSYSWQCVEGGECLLVEFDAPLTGTQLQGFSVSDNSFFLHGFSRIRKCLQTPGPEGQLEAMQLLYGLLLTLIRSSAPRGKQTLLQPAVDYMTEHYDRPNITNALLAKLCGISTVYFRKSFEALYGMSPIRWLNTLRLNRAKDILASDYDSITQIAESVGYAGVYHFSKMFKQYTGVSPTEYAKTSRP